MVPATPCSPRLVLAALACVALVACREGEATESAMPAATSASAASSSAASSGPVSSAAKPPSAVPAASVGRPPPADRSAPSRLDQQWAHVKAATDDGCRDRLDATSAHVMPLMNQNEPDASGCGIPRGVMMQRGPTGAIYTPALRIDCGFATALGGVERIVDEEAQRAFGHRLRGFRHRGSFVCRRVVGRERDITEGMSEHSFGNAIDLESVQLDNGKRIAVLAHYPHPELPEGRFLREAMARIERELGLRVLGPDFDAEHRDHLHIDAGAPASPPH